MNLNKNNIFGAVVANNETYVITNDAQIPTLVVNPVDSPYGTGVMYS